MVVEVACPNCQSKLRAPAGMAGRKARCKKCSTAFVIPGTPSPSDPGELTSSGSQPTMPAAAATKLVEAPTPVAKKSAAVETPTPKEPEPLPFEEDEDDPPAQAESEPAADEVEEFGPARKTSRAGEDVVVSADNPFAIGNLLAPDPPAEKNPAAKAPPEGDENRSYRGPTRGGSNMILFLAAGLGLVAVLGGIGAVITLKKVREKEAEVRQQEEAARKARENPPPPPAPVEEPVAALVPAPAAPAPVPAPMAEAPMPPPMPKSDAKTTPVPPKVPAKAKTISPGKPKGDPKNKAAPAPSGAFTLPANTRTLAFSPTASKQLLVGTQPVTRGLLDAPLAAVKRLFPPEKDAERFAVLWQSAAASFGKAERLTLDRYYQGERQRRVVYEGDGKLPVCDVSADALFFAVVVKGKVTVYDIGEAEAVAPPWEPYARPGLEPLRSGGVAAIHFAANPAFLGTVATTGHVHLWEVKTGAVLGEFAPPATAAVDARAVAVDDQRTHLYVAANGSLNAVALPKKAGAKGGTEAIPKLAAEARSLGGSARVLALAVQSGPEKRVLVAVETLDSKKERAVLGFRAAQATPQGLRLPKGAAEPTTAAWASTFVGVLGLADGSALLIDDERKGTLTAPARLLAPGQALQFPSRDQDQHWVALSDPADAKRTILAGMEIPFDGYASLDSRQAVAGVQLVVK